MKHIKHQFFIVIFAIIFAQFPTMSASSVTCDDVKFIFARGSGSGLNAADFQAFHDSIDGYIEHSALLYSYYELGSSSDETGVTYPASAVGVENFDNFSRVLGAYISGGESFSYGTSVALGSYELEHYIQKSLSECPDTQFVLGGYSQGAQVVSRSLPRINNSHVIYAATFGDPKLYLPEGYGSEPVACQGINLSPYRAYVPDCYAYEGILGGETPYQPFSYVDGQVGAWCIYHDIMCSSYIDLSDPISSHLAYTTDGMYASAAKVIYKKLRAAFPEKFAHPSLDTIFDHTDTADSAYDAVFLFDETGSMYEYQQQYKEEAIKLANKIYAAGGRVALYGYEDYMTPSPKEDGYAAREICNFTNCSDMESFQKSLRKLSASGGGDEEESTLSSLKQVMNSIPWRDGAKKSIIVLTDAPFHNPDLDGTTVEEVVSLSKSIDPVSIYVLSIKDNRAEYIDLTSQTGGAFFAMEDGVEESTNIIFNNIVKPAQSDATPIISDLSLESLSEDSVKISFKTANTERAYVILNDTLMGYYTGEEITFTITDLDSTVDNSLRIVPVSNSGLKGAISHSAIKHLDAEGNIDSIAPLTEKVEIKAPNSGQL